jgi:hypothetical protein
MIYRAIALASLVAFCSCSGSKGSNSSQWTPPAAGVLVAADSVRIANDSLNNGYFSVYLRVAEGNRPNDAFRYSVEARYMKAEAQGTIAMPYGGKGLKPSLRIIDDRTIVMGFVPGELGGGDTTFHPYYRFDGSYLSIHMVPLAAYQINK